MTLAEMLDKLEVGMPGNVAGRTYKSTEAGHMWRYTFSGTRRSKYMTNIFYCSWEPTSRMDTLTLKRTIAA